MYIKNTGCYKFLNMLRGEVLDFQFVSFFTNCFCTQNNQVCQDINNGDYSFSPNCSGS